MCSVQVSARVIEEYLQSESVNVFMGVGSERPIQVSTVRVCVWEGKYRMVRKILHNAGHSVLKLHRVRYGPFRLGDIPPGGGRAMSAEEGEWIQALGQSTNTIFDDLE